MTVDVDVDVPELWAGDGLAWEDIAIAAIDAALSVAPLSMAGCEVGVILTDDDAVQQLNATWRGKDRPTNVLSFPQFDAGSLTSMARLPGMEVALGDIVLARETCLREAEQKGVSLQNHATHLIVHGMLHLLGHDHADDGTADAMEALETKALATLGIANPYDVSSTDDV